MYRVTNPKQAILVWAGIVCGGFAVLQNLPHFFLVGGTSVWEALGAIATVVWLIFIAFGVYYLVRLYRSGQAVAVTSEGLYLRLLGFNGELIPWEKIGETKAKDLPGNKPQIARLYLYDRHAFAEFGGVANLFPTRADVERFVEQVNERIGLAKLEER